MELTARAYNFLLHTCNLGDKTKVVTDPFTGETIQVQVDDGLTVDEIKSLQRVFDQHGIRGPEPHGEGYAVYWPTNGQLRFRSNDLHGSAPVTEIAAELVVKELTDQILSIIFDVARASNVVLTSFVGDCVRILVDHADAKLLSRWPDMQTISSLSELSSWIENKIGGRPVRRLSEY